MEKKTALYEKHVAAGGKMVEFAGYLLPVQYATGILKEHNSVRQQAGLFDVSHMGEFVLEGKGALLNLNHLLANSFTDMQVGQVRYSPMCYPNGGTVDDLLVYKSDEQKYYIVVNASNKDKDFDWMQQQLLPEATLKDISDEVAQVALQGPLATKILEKAATGTIPQKYYTFIENCKIGDISCLISKTGYTGEAGYEIYCCNQYAQALWDALLLAGQEDGLIPCGLGARDTLRLEAGMPLYGHELSEEITPRECGLGFAVKMDKPAFIGKEALLPPRTRKRIGLRLTGRGIARDGAKVYANGSEIGTVTSGTMSPTLGVAIAMALVPANFAEDTLEIELRGKMIPAEVIKLPFYTLSN